MEIERAKAPSIEQLRPVKGSGPTFPIYPDVVRDLLTVDRGRYSPLATHVCAVAAGWAYADGTTLSNMMVRVGFAGHEFERISTYNDAMFIASNAFLIQSECRRVVILCYRGTEPRNFINWLTDADVNPTEVAMKLRGKPVPDAMVHGGFYRNVRATSYEVMRALDRAERGLSINETDGDRAGNAMEALFVTGHSLGAAMAALMAVRLVTDSAYRDRFGARLRGVYTFGQPLVGNDAFAEACKKDPFLRDGVFRHVYGHDIVPRLPPALADDFTHFGRELRGDAEKVWTESETPLEQVGEVLWSTVIVPALAFAAKQIKPMRGLEFAYSWYDHSPTFYIQRSTPPDVESEFER
jgi:hypothetical protein